MHDQLARLTDALSKKYAVERPIGAGGMATVYLARDLKHERAVAIKVFQPEVAEAIGSDRFLREIRTTANLSHPHILPLFDSGEADGFLYFVMPFVTGESLRDRIDREGSLPVTDAVRIAREVAGALAFAHRQGVIHRDVKPANILLESGHALLSDFGIAQAAASVEETRLTGAGMSLGTPSYMSPEQAAGQESVDGRADQYALGCVLYEMLAGHPPYTGSSVQAVLRQHLVADAPMVADARPSTPSGAAKVVGRALEKNPADRFPSMEVLESALAGAGLPFLARIPRRVSRVVMSFAAAGLMAGAAFAVWESLSGPIHELDPNLVAVVPFENRTGDPEHDDLGMYAAEMVRAAIESGFVAEVLPMLVVERQLAAMSESVTPVDVLANELGTGTVVTGSLFAVGDSLQIGINCMDANSGRTLFSVSPVSGSLEDPRNAIREVQTQLTGGLAQRLDQEHAVGRVEHPPANVNAYREYRRGLEMWAQEGSTEDPLPHFLRAWALDSTFVAPLLNAEEALRELGRIAEADSLKGILNRSRHLMTPYQEMFMDRRGFIIRGDNDGYLRISREMAENWPLESAYRWGTAALFTNHPLEATEAYGLWDMGQGRFRDAFVFDFGRWYLGYYAIALHLAGRFEKELEIVREAQKRFPGEPRFVWDEVRARAAVGHVDEMEEIVERWRTAGPDRLESIWNTADELSVHGFEEAARSLLEGEVARFDVDSAYLGQGKNRAMVLYRLGRVEEAHTLWEENIDQARTDPWATVVLETGEMVLPDPHVWSIAEVGYSAALIGDSVQAREMEQRLVAMPEPQHWDTPFLRAKIAAALGEKERAVSLLEEWWEAPSVPTTPFIILHRDLTLHSLLGGYPPFDEFVRPKG